MSCRQSCGLSALITHTPSLASVPSLSASLEALGLRIGVQPSSVDNLRWRPWVDAHVSAQDATVGRRPSFDWGWVAGEGWRAGAEGPCSGPAWRSGRLERPGPHGAAVVAWPSRSSGTGGRASLSAAVPPSRSHRFAVHSITKRRPWSGAARLAHSSQHVLVSWVVTMTDANLG